MAGIQINQGKTVAWSRAGGPAPPGIEALGDPDGEPVWRGDLPPAQNGIVILGTPLGSADFCLAHWKVQERMAEEKTFLEVHQPTTTNPPVAV